MVEVLAVKYLNNIVEQSHRKVKVKMHQYLGCKSWDGAESTLAGVEVCPMIKLGQMIDSDKKCISNSEQHNLSLRQSLLAVGCFVI